MTKMTQKIALNYVIDNCELPEEVKAKIESMIVALEKKSAKSGERMKKRERLISQSLSERDGKNYHLNHLGE